MPVVCFGEMAWYKQIREHKDRKSKFDSEWREGVWLGHSRNCNEVLAGTGEGVVRAYTVKRMDEEMRWDADKIRNMKGTPQQPVPSKAGLHIPIRVRFDATPSDSQPIDSIPLRRETQPRRMKITKDVLQRYCNIFWLTLVYESFTSKAP